MDKTIAVILCILSSLSLVAALETDMYGDAAINNNVDTNIDVDISLQTKNEVRNAVSMDSEIELQEESDAPQGTIFTALLSNGNKTYIQISPLTASAKAQSQTRGTCETKCEVELTEEKVNGETKAVYEVDVYKKAKMLGFIHTNMEVTVQVDAQNGEVITIERPWWAFLAVEDNTSVQVNTNTDVNANANEGY